MAIEIIVPRSGWSMEEGTFAGWLKQDGEKVKPGDRLFSLESDKAVLETESMDEGILRIPLDAPKSGDRVKVGQLLGYLVSEGEALPATAGVAVSAQASPVASVSSSEPEPPAPIPNESSLPLPVEIPATPRARRAAAELGLDLAELRGTGRGRRIRERDVRRGSTVGTTTTQASELPITVLRRTIADRMMRSRAQTAPVTLTCHADATNLVALRNQFKAAGNGTLVPSYTDMIAKLAAIALLRHPLLAARWDNDRIVLPKEIAIGIATDTEHGLLVPVIRNIAHLSLSEVTRTSRALIEAARTRQIKPDDLQGGVFTITNLGGFGIEAFTPIINYPETAILGLGTIRRESVALENGDLTSREQLMLSLTFDHRIIDGAPAARFLQILRERLENPAAWLLVGNVG